MFTVQNFTFYIFRLKFNSFYRIDKIIKQNKYGFKHSFSVVKYITIQNKTV